MTEPHSTPLRVAFDEVDMYGIVHHSKLLVYLERARIAMFVAGGMTPGTLEETGFGLVVVDAQMRFRTPARFPDELVVETSVLKVSPVTVTLGYEVRRGSDVILTASTRLAAVGADGRPIRLPATARTLLDDHLVAV
jgi:acyl-CoA thioester hydrolase